MINEANNIIEDVETETALAALADLLTWKDYFPGTDTRTSNVCIAYTENSAWYAVGDEGGEWSTWFSNKRREQGPRVSSCKAAKRLCERHYVTENWR